MDHGHVATQGPATCPAGQHSTGPQVISPLLPRRREPELPLSEGWGTGTRLTGEGGQALIKGRPAMKRAIAADPGVRGKVAEEVQVAKAAAPATAECPPSRLPRPVERRAVAANGHRGQILTAEARSPQAGRLRVNCDHGGDSGVCAVARDDGDPWCDSSAEAWMLFAWHAAGEPGRFIDWWDGPLPVPARVNDQVRAGVERWRLPVDATGRTVQVGHLAVQNFPEQTHSRRVVRIFARGSWLAEMVSAIDGSTFTEDCNRLRIVSQEAVDALVRVDVQAHGHHGRVIEAIAAGKAGQFRVICACDSWFELIEPGRSRAVAWRKSEREARALFDEHAAAAPIFADPMSAEDCQATTPGTAGKDVESVAAPSESVTQLTFDIAQNPRLL